MRRKTVLRRLISISEVQAALAAHREAIASQLDARPANQNAQPISTQGPFDLVGRELAALERQLVDAEDRHTRKRVQLEQLRRESRERFNALYSKQRATRQVLAGLFGADHAFQLAAVSGKTPQTSRALVEQVNQTLELLRRPEQPLPEPLIAGFSPDFNALANDLEATLTALRESRRAYEQLRKAADRTRLATQAALKETDRVFPQLAGTLENLFRLADEPDLAQRIRTSSRRVTRRQGVRDDEMTSVQVDNATTSQPTDEASALRRVANDLTSPSRHSDDGAPATTASLPKARSSPGDRPGMAMNDFASE
ncbi:MAG: hypothetical protein AAF560_05890 [Acidobacteriota bacterium]